ncbi:MAG: M24 family metallopeptidase, partial [Gaiellaceae bacterium]
MNTRIAKLRERLEEPLLVTNSKNVVYLAGFESSNAVLLVDRERVRLFTDFRYIQAARAIPGVEVVQTRRAVIAELPELLSGRVGFEATTLTYAQYDTLAKGGLELVPRAGLVESLRAVKDEGELDALRRACTITDRVFERLTELTFAGRTERAVAWDLQSLFHEEGGDGLAFESI